MRRFFSLVPLTLFTAPALAQQNAIVFTMDAPEFLLDGAGGQLATATLSPGEVAIFAPDPASSPSARTFLTAGAQYVFLGDADNDGLYVDSGTGAPGGAVDALMIKRWIGAPSAPIAPRSLYFSKESDQDVGSLFQDGDVFTFLAQGSVAMFVSEAQLQVGMGTTDNFDVDAICQTETGDILFSVSDFSVNLTGASGAFNATDGDLLYFAAADVTYDIAGNVTALTADSVQRVAAELDLVALIAASGMRTSVGTNPVSSIDLSALDLDPAGGTWSSPQGGVSLPNLLFAWEGFTNDGALISTAGGGTLGVVNGVTMGSTQATTGAQIGLLPDATGLDGLSAMALIANQRESLLVETWPTNLITGTTTLYTEQQVSGASSGGLVALFYDLGPQSPGGNMSAVAVGGFLGAVYGSQLSFPLLSIGVADADGLARFPATLPSHLVGSGANLALQVLDVRSRTFGEPIGLQFL